MKTKPKRKSFNWLTALSRAVKDEPSEDEQKQLMHKAYRWLVCACGQLCKRLPRYSDKKPRDRTLRELGCNFAGYVCCRKWQSAITVFHQIEARTAELLRAKK